MGAESAEQVDPAPEVDEEPIPVDPSEPQPIPVNRGAAQPAADAVPRVKIGKFAVPLPWVLGLARASCSICAGRGTVRRLGPKGGEEICPCAGGRAQRRLAAFVSGGQTVDPPPEAPVDERDLVRAQRRLEGLRRQLATDGHELAKRRARLEDTLAAERAGQRVAASAEQDAAAAVILNRDSADRLRLQVEELTKELAARRVMLAGAEAAWTDAQADRTRASREREEREVAIQRAEGRWEADIVGLRKRLAKDRRRLEALERDGGRTPVDEAPGAHPAESARE